MRKLLVVLLSLGLIAAFSMTAFAASGPDIKMSGQYYVVGWYDNNNSLNDTDKTFSRAAFWQRTRVRTDLKVVEGVDFTFRFDAQEKQWGNTEWSSAGTQDKSNSKKSTPMAAAQQTTVVQENFEFEYGYVTFATKIGQFQIGYQATDEWGTGFADIPGARPRFLYVIPIGPVQGIVLYEKIKELDYSNITGGPVGKVDADGDVYGLGAIFKFKGGETGLLWKYTVLSYTKGYTAASINTGALAVNANPYKTLVHAFAPYMKATFGPVYVEAELVYLTGKQAKYDDPPAGQQDVDKEGYGAYVMAKVNVGPAYVGGTFGYSSGDDGQDATKNKSGPESTTGWNPNLFFANQNTRSFLYGSNAGTGNVNGASGWTTGKQNLVIFNVFAGFNPTPKWNVETTLSTMWADKKPYVGAVQYVSDKYGTELDLKVTYKIYDNLTYMLAGGYLWTGDFFKRANANGVVGNDYMLLNQLTLNF